ncbi:PRC-barrel domain-containing protein [Oceanicella sp. SM1341]|uniref:PRC-barrel domain-containing protein n=1 Tax=Oceanicella sp. SM1341 TaxID=1548889 RepID=UPI000E4DF3E4|nr:PRC-barrel domain-containing protein [Oceanicella sp. SM1341]
MKRLIATTAIALVMGGGAVYAQDVTESTYLEAPTASDVYASELIGSRVYGSETPAEADMARPADGDENWEDLGEVSDVVMDENGDIRAVLVDVGGFLGIGEKTVAVEMSDLSFLHENDDPDDTFIAINTTREALENAPAFEREDDTAAMATDSDTAAVEGDSMDNADTAMTTNENGTDQMSADNVPDTEMAEADTDMGADRTTSAGGGTMMAAPEGYTETPADQIKSDALIGATVYDQNEAEIGEVTEIVLNEDGTAQDAIVDVGGFLGLGAKPVAVDFKELQVMQGEDENDLRIYVPTTEEQLNDMPTYEG